MKTLTAITGLAIISYCLYPLLFFRYKEYPPVNRQQIEILVDSAEKISLQADSLYYDFTEKHRRMIAIFKQIKQCDTLIRKKHS